LQQIFSQLPANFPAPILVVQHIADNFIGGFIKWLETSTELNVKLAEQGETAKAGTVYFAPDDHHLVTGIQNENVILLLNQAEEVEHFRPSATVLLNSISKVFPGKAIGGVLTGMGKDGAQGLSAMHEAQCKTFIQDEESSVVFGMPREAQKLGAADNVLSIDEIAKHIVSLL
jgi:two-component system, chemotaxis family, protein-glutamate methylesterase/glutaminase